MVAFMASKRGRLRLYRVQIEPLRGPYLTLCGPTRRSPDRDGRGSVRALCVGTELRRGPLRERDSAHGVGVPLGSALTGRHATRVQYVGNGLPGHARRA